MNETENYFKRAFNRVRKKNISILPSHRVMDAMEFADYWKFFKKQQKYGLLARALKATLLLSQFLFLTIYYLRILWLSQQFSSCN